MADTAQEGGHDSDRVSFVEAIRITRQTIAQQSDFSP